MSTTFVADVETLDVDRVTEIGREMWGAFQEDTLFATLVEECGNYLKIPWPRVGGMMAIPGFNAGVHGDAYIAEGLKAMIIYAAVGAMVPLPTTVDDAMHAAFTQQDLMEDLRGRLDIHPVHRTTHEPRVAPYTPECITDVLYLGIFGEEPPAFYWRSQESIDEVADLTAEVLASFGIHGVSRQDSEIVVVGDVRERMRAYLAGAA